MKWAVRIAALVMALASFAISFWGVREESRVASTKEQVDLLQSTVDLIRKANARDASGTYVVHTDPGRSPAAGGWECSWIFVEKDGTSKPGCVAVRGGVPQPFHVDYLLPGEGVGLSIEFSFPPHDDVQPAAGDESL